MKAAIGIDSRNVYATGNDKEECFRKLSVLYPGLRKNKQGSPTPLHIYPEALKIVNVRWK